MQDLINVGPNAVSREAEAIVDLVRQAQEYATKSKAANTVKAYQKVWRTFRLWCERMDVKPEHVDARLVSAYVTDRAEELSASSIQVMLAGLAENFAWAGIPVEMEHPHLKKVVAGIMRSKPRRPGRQATAATPDILRKMLAACDTPDVPMGARDRGILLLGFAGALRRSEMVALRIEDVRLVPGRGFQLLIRRSKTDQMGVGRELTIAANPRDPEFCPVVAVERWLSHRPNAEPQDALFTGVNRYGPATEKPLCAARVALIIKKVAERAGLPPGDYSGHSLRRGFLTAAVRAQAPLVDVMGHARHKTAEVTLRYVEEAQAWDSPVSGRVFDAA